MAAFAFDGSEFNLKLNDADASVIAQRIRQGRSVALNAVEEEAARRKDHLVGKTAYGTYYISFLFSAVEHYEAARRIMFVTTVLTLILCGGLGLTILSRMVVVLSAGEEVAIPSVGVVLALMFIIFAVMLARSYNAIRNTPIVARGETVRDLVDKVSMSVGFGNKAVYLGSGYQDRAGVLLGSVRVIQYDAIGDASGHDGHLRIDDRAGRPLVSMGVAGDGQELREMVAFIRGRLST